MTPAYRRYWLKHSVPALRAQDRLEDGSVSAEEVYDVAMLAFGDEDVASAIYAAKLAALNRQANVRGV